MVSCYHWVSISIFKNCVCACGVSCWYRGRSTPEKGLLPNLDLAVLARMARQGSPPGIWAGFLWPTRWRTLLQGVLLSTGRPWHTVKHPFYKLQWLKQSDPQRRAQHTAGTAPPSASPSVWHSFHSRGALLTVTSFQANQPSYPAGLQESCQMAHYPPGRQDMRADNQQTSQ